MAPARHRSDAAGIGQQAGQRAGDAQRHVQERDVGAHCQAAGLRRRAAHGFHAEAGEGQRVAEAGERGADVGHDGRVRAPDQQLAGRFDDHAHQRDLGAADLVGQMAEEQAGADEGHAERGEGQRGIAPILGREQQGDEGGDDAKADAGQGQAHAGAQTALSTLNGVRRWLVGAIPRTPATTASASMGTNSVATEMPLKPHRPLTTTPAGARVGAVHGDAVPGHDLAGVLRPDQADAPAHRAGDDQAFAHGQQDAAGHQDPHRRGRRVKKGQRGQIEQARGGGGHRARHHGALGAAHVGVVAGPRARQQGRGELRADHQADHQRVHAQGVVQVQRQHGQLHADDQEADEYRQRERQQLDHHIGDGAQASRATRAGYVLLS